MSPVIYKTGERIGQRQSRVMRQISIFTINCVCLTTVKMLSKKARKSIHRCAWGTTGSGNLADIFCAPLASCQPTAE